MPHFQEVLTRLSKQGGVLWHKILSLKKPNTYQALTWLAYALEEIKAAQPLGSMNHLAIVIENFPEWKIFNEAKNIIKKLNDSSLCSNMIGIYPLEKLIVENEHARSFALYANDWPNTFIDNKNQSFSYESLLNTIYN